MPAILIQMDQQLLDSLDRIAPAENRKRAEFVRKAVRDAIRRHQEERIRAAYLLQPDAAADADDWSNAEEWKE